MFKNIFRKSCNPDTYTKTRRLDYFTDGFGNAVELLEIIDRHNTCLRYEVYTHLDVIRLDGKTMNIPGVTSGTKMFPATEQGRASAQKVFNQTAYNMLDEEELETARIRDRVMRNPELCFFYA